MHLTSSIMKDQAEESKKTKDLVLEFFNKKTQMYKAYRVLDDVFSFRSTDEEEIKDFLQEARNQFSLIDSRQLFNENTRLIQEMKKLSPEIMNQFLPEYKNIMNVCHLIKDDKTVKEGLDLNSKVKKMIMEKEDDTLNYVDDIILKQYVKNFDTELNDSLNESQQSLIKDYINLELDSGEMRYSIRTRIKSICETLERSYDDEELLDSSRESMKKLSSDLKESLRVPITDDTIHMIMVGYDVLEALA